MSTTGKEFGMQTQEYGLKTLVKKGLITENEAYMKAARPEEFKKVMSLPF